MNPAIIKPAFTLQNEGISCGNRISNDELEELFRKWETPEIEKNKILNGSFDQPMELGDHRTMVCATAKLRPHWINSADVMKNIWVGRLVSYASITG